MNLVTEDLSSDIHLELFKTNLNRATGEDFKTTLELFLGGLDNYISTYLDSDNNLEHDYQTLMSLITVINLTLQNPKKINIKPYLQKITNHFKTVSEASREYKVIGLRFLKVILGYDYKVFKGFVEGLKCDWGVLNFLLKELNGWNGSLRNEEILKFSETFFNMEYTGVPDFEGVERFYEGLKDSENLGYAFNRIWLKKIGGRRGGMGGGVKVLWNVVLKGVQEDGREGEGRDLEGERKMEGKKRRREEEKVERGEREKRKKEVEVEEVEMIVEKVETRVEEKVEETKIEEVVKQVESEDDESDGDLDDIPDIDLAADVDDEDL